MLGVKEGLQCVRENSISGDTVDKFVHNKPAKRATGNSLALQHRVKWNRTSDTKPGA
jgi:hypothetical protein